MEITSISHMCLTLGEQIIQWCLQLCVETVGTERQHGRQMQDVIQCRYYRSSCGVYCITVSYLFQLLQIKLKCVTTGRHTILPTRLLMPMDAKHAILHLQLFFARMNPLGLKHIGYNINSILIYKIVHFVGLWV